jgi:hypothetical protein
MGSGIRASRDTSETVTDEFYAHIRQLACHLGEWCERSTNQLIYH